MDYLNTESSTMIFLVGDKLYARCVNGLSSFFLMCRILIWFRHGRRPGTGAMSGGYVPDPLPNGSRAQIQRQRRGASEGKWENGVSVQILTEFTSVLSLQHATEPAYRISRRILPRDGAWQPT
jgi:hypothetical protein